MIVTIYIIDDSKYLNGKQTILAFNFVYFFHKTELLQNKCSI